MQTRRARGLVIGVATIFLHSLLAGVAPLPTYARVDPLTIIKRQIHKPNMLVVLDTSGSLTGVPGGTFDNTAEVGVDCDAGDFCRGGASVGTCASAHKSCAGDDDCRMPTCSVGFAQCTTTADCPPIAGSCTTGQNCFLDADCPALTTGHCKNTGSTCSAGTKCTVQNRCLYNGNTCASDTDCATGLCTNNVTGCRSTADCPYQTSGGTCAYVSTPAGGCATVANCPVRPKACSDNPAKTCSTVNDCGGTCKKNKTACASNNDCKQKSGDSCDFSGKTCTSPANSCLLPQYTCTTVHADNVCHDINTCQYNTNTCSGVATNPCLAGVAGDLCNATTGTTGSRMCRIGQSKCLSNTDCKIAGDTCGLATSRFVTAKRVIRNIVNANANVLNLGLMTFYQNRYFPYYKVTSGTSTTTSTLFQQATLAANSCYSKTDGLTSSCTINGGYYTLRASNNSHYVIQVAPGDSPKSQDVNYCGWFCGIAGQGTGVFGGAYYESQQFNGTLASSPTLFTTYRGKSFTEAGITYRYYDARPDYYNGGASPPIDVANCGSSCSASCGGRWDSQLAPMLTTDDSDASVTAVINAVNQAMSPASQGGLISYGGTPSGCALENNGAPDVNHSAYHYMSAVKAADSLTCRQNFVLFITDGEANGPGDTSCTSTACAAADPVAAGCTCRAVTAAFHLRQNLGVRTFVVGFSTDAAAGNGRIINDNIARAGGTDADEDGVSPFAYGASSETQLSTVIQAAIYQAVKGSYGTAPSTASQGGQAGASLEGGTLVLDSRADFPAWKGHLVAYDVSGSAPQLMWDAGTLLETKNWRNRKVYTSDASNQLVRLQADATTNTITNKDQLFALGLGATADEAERIARFVLGDPLMNNPAVMGAIINSTPIDVAQPPDGSLPGAHEFYLANRSRPSLVYVGADDGMLHAFYTRSALIGGVTKSGGSEAFAYIPRSMLPVISTLYAQGGQLADPKQHIYGLATSPKVKNVCVSNCTSKTDSVWRTVLIMAEGWGGPGVFALDVTDPFSGTNPFSVLWTTQSTTDASTFTSLLGRTVPVPAFTFKRSDSLDDHRILMTSSYPIDSNSTTQGRSLISMRASTGAILGQVAIQPSGSCSQDYAMVGDIATSRQQVPSDNGAVEGRKELIVGYAGDTWGNLWQYDKDGALSSVASFGCQHPLHFAPTVVQLDQDDPYNPYAGDIYLVQVTNSTTDTATESFPGSRMIILKQRNVEGRPVLDTTFGTNGQVVLTAGNSAQLCAVSDVTGQTCLQTLSAGARPLGTPLAIPRTDGTGFTVLSNWYQPATSGCGKGATYFLMHAIAGATVTLKQALKVADEPVVSPVVAGGKLMVTGSTGPINLGGSVTTTIQKASATGASSGGDLFQSGGWSEVE